MIWVYGIYVNKRTQYLLIIGEFIFVNWYNLANHTQVFCQSFSDSILLLIVWVYFENCLNTFVEFFFYIKVFWELDFVFFLNQLCIMYCRRVYHQLLMGRIYLISNSCSLLSVKNHFIYIMIVRVCTIVKWLSLSLCSTVDDYLF